MAINVSALFQRSTSLSAREVFLWKPGFLISSPVPLTRRPQWHIRLQVWKQPDQGVRVKSDTGFPRRCGACVPPPPAPCNSSKGWFNTCFCFRAGLNHTGTFFHLLLSSPLSSTPHTFKHTYIRRTLKTENKQRFIEKKTLARVENIPFLVSSLPDSSHPPKVCLTWTTTVNFQW